MSKLPNILFLMTDEHRADITGYEGNSVIRTRILDRLAETGIVFRNAYTPSPICIPARQAMMAGQFPNHCGCRVYGQDLAPGYMTFARWLSKYSYATVACGKLHHMGVDQMQGWTNRIGSDMEIHPSFIEDREEDEFQEHIPIFSDMKWSDVKEIKRAGIGKGPYQVMDEYTVKGAIDFLDNYFINPYYDRQQSTRPLLLKVSLLNPHYPYLAEEDKFKYYLNRVEPYLNESVSEHPFLSQRQVIPGIDASERELKRATAAYYSMIETADEQFGQVIDKLEQCGQNLDDWIVIYTSDHGEMLGEHCIWEKQKFYEASARVPLIIRWPEKFNGGKVIYENVNLCDLFATLCDLLNVKTPENLDSRSLVPLMKGAASEWNNESISQFGLKNLMIKRDDLKYQYYGDDLPEVLFDLKRDPKELYNLINEKRYSEDVNLFRQRRKELGY